MFKTRLPDSDGNYVEHMVVFIFPHKHKYIQNQTTTVCKIMKKVVADDDVRGYKWQQVTKGTAKLHSVRNVEIYNCPHCKKEVKVEIPDMYNKAFGRKFAFKNAVKSFTDKKVRTTLWKGYWERYER